MASSLFAVHTPLQTRIDPKKGYHKEFPPNMLVGPTPCLGGRMDPQELCHSFTFQALLPSPLRLLPQIIGPFWVGDLHKGGGPSGSPLKPQPGTYSPKRGA